MEIALNRFAIAAASLMLYSASQALAQDSPLDCRGVLLEIRAKAAQSKLGYSQVGSSADFSLRCEGIYDEEQARLLGPAAVTDLRVAHNDVPITKGLLLRVKPAARIPGDRTSVRVATLPARFNSTYRMDAQIEALDGLRWPASDFLVGRFSSTGELAAYGWTEFENTRIYVPLSMQRFDEPAALDPKQAPANFRLILRLAYPSEQVWFAVADCSTPKICTQPTGGYRKAKLTSDVSAELQLSPSSMPLSKILLIVTPMQRAREDSVLYLALQP